MILMPLLSLGASPPGTDWRKEADDMFQFDDPRSDMTRYSQISIATFDCISSQTCRYDFYAPPRTAKNRSLARSCASSQDVGRPAAPVGSQPHLFGRDAPLEVEVGSGKGLFLQSAAQRHAGAQFPRRRDRPQIRPVLRRPPGSQRDSTNAVMVQRRRPAAVRRTPARRIAGRRARLLPRSVVEEAAPQAPRDERDGSSATSPARSRPAARSTSGPTSTSYFDATLELIAAHTPLVGPLDSRRAAGRARSRLPHAFRAPHAAAPTSPSIAR